ncbi:PAS sensor protein, partial [Streptomyces bungoensis]
MPHDGSARARVAQPRATGAGPGATGTPPRMPEAAASVRVLAFTGAALAAVYAPGTAGELRLVDVTGSAGASCALPERLSLSGDSPAAHVVRTGRPLWLNHAALAAFPEGGPAPSAQASLGALPLR